MGRGRGGPMGSDTAEVTDGFMDATAEGEVDELNALRAESSRLKELLENIEQRLSKFKAPQNER
jgi:hypothetical protein